jgi:HlyD family secretion protein
MTRKKLIFGAAGLLLGLSAVVYTFIKPADVEMLRLEDKPFEELIVEEGLVRSKDEMPVYVPLSERVEKVHVKEGNYVHEGDALFTMNTEDLKIELSSAELEKDSLEGLLESAKIEVTYETIGAQRERVEIAQRNMESLKMQLDRIKNLYDAGAESQKSFEDAQQGYENSRSTYQLEYYNLESLTRKLGLDAGTEKYYQSKLEVLDHQITKVKIKIEDAEVIAPSDGFVADMELSAGDRLVKNEIACEIMSENNLEVEVFILARNSRKLKLGDQVRLEIETDYDYETVQGEITYIGKSAVDVLSPLGITEKKMKVIIQPKSSEKLIIGEAIDVAFIMYENEHVMQINRDYIFRSEGNIAVWTVQDGAAHIQRIEPVYEIASAVIVSAEPDQSLEIMIPPYPDHLEEGLKVRILNK